MYLPLPLNYPPNIILIYLLPDEYLSNTYTLHYTTHTHPYGNLLFEF